MLHHCFCITLVIVSMVRVTAGNADPPDFVFGECQPGKESCRDCYLELVKSLLGNGENVFNLSYEFTPPLEDVPNSVIIKYHFINETMHYTKRWYWAQSGAYFLHPLFVFQFISFLFGNPKPIYERVIDVTLNATECYGVDKRHMILLTQRVSCSCTPFVRCSSLIETSSWQNFLSSMGAIYNNNIHVGSHWQARSGQG
jgi:hypothetical protein